MPLFQMTYKCALNSPSKTYTHALTFSSGSKNISP